ARRRSPDAPRSQRAHARAARRRRATLRLLRHRPRRATPPGEAARLNVLVISSEPVGDSMLGSAIRAFELARALGAKLVAPETDFPRHDARALRPHLAKADVVITQPPWPHVMAELRRSRARLVFDLYDPEPLEE